MGWGVGSKGSHEAAEGGIGEVMGPWARARRENLLFLFVVALTTFVCNATDCNIDQQQNGRNTERQKFIEVHSKLRENIVKGTAYQSLGIVPTGSNMYDMTYNCRMEYDLQKELDKCTGKITNFKGYGQNLAIVYNSPAAVNPVDKIDDVLNSWINAGRIYGIQNSENMYLDPRTYTFANMAYAKSLRFGCAYAQCGANEAHISCVYNLIGAYENNTIYEKGSQCTNDRDCTTYPGSRCKKQTGLCIYKGTPPCSGGGTNTMCQGNKGMTDEGRKKVLEAHNTRRSLLARGLVQNGKSTSKLPSSLFMPKMIYNCETEASAIEYANGCSLKKSEESTRPGVRRKRIRLPITERRPRDKKDCWLTAVYKCSGNYNLVSRDLYELAKLLAATSWWDQITKEAIDRQVTYSVNLRNKEIDQSAFTQMAWASSVRLGCAIQTCFAKSFIVCRYSPAGNVLKEQIYKPGVVCKGCQAACKTSDGLCDLF
ncbi:hypothetical protein RB195_012431 [Necator americanus]|uniref:SCP domain-containing protein n=1 Tax=Necator americanus TaxID=51031 RepID=A0ABR1D720_NECAM